jgi:hypothetical protein
MLIRAHSSLNSSVLDKRSTGEMSYRSHWETSYTVQSDTRLLEYDGQIPCQQSLHAYEKKSSNVMGMFLDNAVGVFIYSIPRRNETVCCIESINDCLMNPISTLNTIHINALKDPMYLVCRAFHIQNPSTLVFSVVLIQNLSGYLPDCEISQVYGCIGNQMRHMQAIGSLVPVILLVRFLLEYNDNENTLLAMRYGRSCPFSIDVAFSNSIDKLTS